MDAYQLEPDDAHVVIAALRRFAEELRDSPSSSAEATMMLRGSAADVDALADDIRVTAASIDRYLKS